MNVRDTKDPEAVRYFAKLAVAEALQIVYKHHPHEKESVGEAISDDLVRWLKQNDIA